MPSPHAPSEKSLLRCPTAGAGRGLSSLPLSPGTRAEALVPPLPYIPAQSSRRSPRSRTPAPCHPPGPTTQCLIRFVPPPPCPSDGPPSLCPHLPPSVPPSPQPQPHGFSCHPACSPPPAPHCLPPSLSILSESQLCASHPLLRLPPHPSAKPRLPGESPLHSIRASVPGPP